MLRRLFAAIICFALVICPLQAQYNSPSTTAVLDAPFKKASSAFALTFQTNTKDFGGGGTTVNYGTVTYGSFNEIVILISFKSTTTGVTISSLSLNGAAGTQIAGAYKASGSNTNFVDIWKATPTGTSGTLSITYSASVSSGSGTALYGLNTTTLTPSTAGPGQTTTFGTTISATYTVPSGGGSVLVVAAANNNPSFTWSGGATTDGGRTDGNMVQNYAHTTSTGSLTPLATASTSDLLMYTFAAWGP